jgi:predicted amino acid racemase
MEHDDVVRVVESPAGQEAQQFYQIAHRSMFSDGLNMLTKLHNRGYLRKYPTNQIELTPNSTTVIKLSEVNEIIRKQSTGMSEADIKNSMVDDTDKAPRNMDGKSTQIRLDPSQTIDQAVPTQEAALDDVTLAKNMLTQADVFLAEAQLLQDEE